MTFAPRPHPCQHEGCGNTVQYDDEPFCFTHSPDEGSYQRGYSYAARHAAAELLGDAQ